MTAEAFLGEAAVRYAARKSWRVLPLHTPSEGSCSCGDPECSSPGKHPRTPHGVKDASADPEVVRGWWARWPAANVGIATGSGLILVDGDAPDELASLNLPESLSFKTGRGRNVLFSFNGGRKIGNSAGKLPPRGGVPGEGGFFVAPPSIHANGRRYAWLPGPSSLAPLPEALLDRLREKDGESRRATTVAIPVPPEGGGSAYGLAALEAEIARVRSAQKGQRNQTLNIAAFNLATLTGGGELELELASQELLAAAIAAGLAERESARTIQSGFAAGLERPRQAPPSAIARERARDPKPLPAPPAVPTPEGERLKITRYSELDPEPVQWLVEGLIPTGRTTVLYGSEGEGKGLWWISVAAEISLRQLTTVAFVTEDRPEEDVLPRFLAAGGDPHYLAHVEIEGPKPGELPRQLDLGRDQSFFEEAIRGLGADLVVLDPMLGQIDMSWDANQAQHVRSFMRPLDAIVGRHGAALLAIVHLNRALSSDPMRRVSASKAFRELARSTLILGRDPADPQGDGRVLALDKANLAKEATSRLYRIERLAIDYEDQKIPTARIVLVGESELRARDLLLPPDSDAANELDKAVIFLRDLLTDGAVLAQTGYEFADAQRISRRTLERARKTLGVKASAGAKAMWELPAPKPTALFGESES